MRKSNLKDFIKVLDSKTGVKHKVVPLISYKTDQHVGFFILRKDFKVNSCYLGFDCETDGECHLVFENNGKEDRYILKSNLEVYEIGLPIFFDCYIADEETGEIDEVIYTEDFDDMLCVYKLNFNCLV